MQEQVVTITRNPDFDLDTTRTHFPHEVSKGLRATFNPIIDSSHRHISWKDAKDENGLVDVISHLFDSYGIRKATINVDYENPRQVSLQPLSKYGRLNYQQ